MYINDAKRWLKILVESEVPVAPLFVGPMGCGKSEIVKQVATELKIDLVDLRLAQMETGDLIGIPHKVCNAECGKEGRGCIGEHRTDWALPAWFPKPGTRGIIFLDELNRAPHDVRQAVFQLIWDKKMHLHSLPKGWAVVAAINPPGGESEYQVEELDKAMLRRFCVVVTQPDVDVWLKWARIEGKVNKDITSFIATHKDMLFEYENIEMPVKRNNAAWSVINMLYAAKAIPADLEFEIIAGLVGREAAVAFRKHLDENYTRPVSGEDILKAYETVKDRVKAQATRTDEMYVTIKDLVHAVDALNKKLNKKQNENAKAFLLDIPADHQAQLIHDLPHEIVSEWGNDPKVVDVVGAALKAAKEGLKND